jgi:hypothetical protein
MTLGNMRKLGVQRLVARTPVIRSVELIVQPDAHDVVRTIEPR